MGMNRNYKNNNSNVRRKHEEEFLCDYKQAYSDILEIDIERQKEAIKNAIVHIKRARDYGTDIDVLKDMFLFNNSNFIDLIKDPTINDFYQYRTYMALSKNDIELYLKEIIESGIDIYKYTKGHANSYSANIRNNYITFVCRMIRDIEEAEQYTDSKELHDIAEKIRNKTLTINDFKTLSKFISQYLDQMKIGKAAMWSSLKKDPEECIKMLLKNKDILFDVKTVELNKKSDDKISQEEEIALDDLKPVYSNMYSIKNYSLTKKTDNIKIVSFKKYKKPFISKNKEESFLTCMSCVLADEKEDIIRKFYSVIEHMQSEKDSNKRNYWKKKLVKCIMSIEFGGTIFSANKYLKNRIAAIVNYLYSLDSLKGACDRNNLKLHSLGLDALKIEQDELISKFVKGGNKSSVYYFDPYTNLFEMSKGTAFSDSSDEIIIGLAAFYTNRMAKEFKHITDLSYIFNKKGIIEKIYENEDFDYDDIGINDEELCKYMALYNVLREKISKKIAKVSDDEKQDEELHKEIHDSFSCYSNICKKIEGENKIDFKQDLDNIMVDAISMKNMYRLKEFAVKSLIYTASTDECKNIINWGYVSEEKKYDNFILLGFDIKGLNMPIFMHMREDDIKKLMINITGQAKIPVYEGDKDMYHYSAGKRITGQVIYPLSKDDKKKINKMDDKAARTDYFKHIKWLANSNAKPDFKHEPGSRLYDFEKRIIVSNAKNTKKRVDIEEKEC